MHMLKKRYILQNVKLVVLSIAIILHLRVILFDFLKKYKIEAQFCSTATVADKLINAC